MIKFILFCLYTLEKQLRFVGYVIGFMSLFFTIWAGSMYYQVAGPQNKLDKQTRGDLIKMMNFSIDTSVFYFLIISTLLGSIFLLVATRKFKVINRLMEERGVRLFD